MDCMRSKQISRVCEIYVGKNDYESALSYLQQLENTAEISQNRTFAQSNLMKGYYKSDAQIIIARSAIKSGNEQRAEEAFAEVKNIATGENAAEAWYYDAYFKNKNGAFEASNVSVQKLAKDYASYKQWGGMRKHTTITITLCLSLFWIGVQAQETDDIGTETVTVVKPYSPTVSDAFKIKSTPSLSDSIVLQKKNIKYNIFSVPVASTFTPAKAKAARVEKTPPPVLYNSYASVGLGNFNNALVDFYTSRDFNRGEDLLDVGLSHHSSRGEIDTTPLDADFYNSNLDVSYAKKDRDLDWGAGIGLRHQRYNWYGVQNGEFDDTTIEGIDEGQNYFTAQTKAHINLRLCWGELSKCQFEQYNQFGCHKLWPFSSRRKSKSFGFAR